ncbi:MAG: transposase family protein [Syntrophorhabdaceae bacterium]
MDRRVISRMAKGSLRVSVDVRNKGLKDIDFIADHTHLDNLMQFNASRPSADMGPLYLRCALTSITCPECGAEVKRSYRAHPLEWVLKFAGRKVFHCTHCNWREIVKMGQWEWQTVLTVLAAFTIVLAASIHWILR